MSGLVLGKTGVCWEQVNRHGQETNREIARKRDSLEIAILFFIHPATQRGVIKQFCLHYKGAGPFSPDGGGSSLGSCMGYGGP